MQKKILLLILSLTISTTFLKAQKGIPDFTITDIYGKEHNLFNDYLDNGKYVFIDFFGVSCSFCQDLAPIVDTVYKDYGCNYGEVIFLGINADNYSPNNNDSSTWQFTEKFNMTFPAASGLDGNGYSAFSDYGDLLDFNYTPYKILISPDKEVIINDMIIEETAHLDDTLSYYGISKKDCEGNNFKFYSIVTKTDSVVGIIDDINNTINITIPENNDITKLVANFRNAPNSTVTVNGVEQISKETQNDFTNPVIYEITSETGISENWQVNLTTSSGIDVYSNNFKLYPNPSPTGIFILENNLFSENNSHFTANIINITGQTVKTISINETDNIIDLSNFKKGIYFIEINANNFKISKKLMLY